MSLLPKSGAEWTRSLARPLSYCCAGILVFRIVSMGERFWRYGSSSAVDCVLLPIMGLLLVFTCMMGDGLSKEFRIMAWIVALLSMFGGLLFMPQLAE
jgi:hypothetical protein